MKKPLLLEILFVVVLIAVLHQMALSLFLYWTTSWFDIMMHTLGGFWLGILFIFILFTSGYFPFPNKPKLMVLVVVLSLVLVVGLGWELWEIFVGFTNVLRDQVDTALDLVMDLIGGNLALLYSKKYLWKTEN